MALDWIELSHFRSYQRLNWHPDPGVNLLVGDNGAGKTNVLEAVAFLGSQRSFRGAPDEALVSDGAESAILRGEFTTLSSSILVEAEVKQRGGKVLRLNGARSRLADLVEAVRLVTFVPEDLDLVKGGPGSRRDYLDESSIQLWPVAALDQAEMDRALRQRNALLRTGVFDEASLAVWDARLAQAGAKVMARRARMIAATTGFVEEAYRHISESPARVEWAYGSSWGGSLDPGVTAAEWADALSRALESGRQTDRDRRATGFGPHRDDPVLLLDGADSRFHASQGEQRTLALSLRLGLQRAIAELAGAAPLLLLDDVFSELDGARGKALASGLLPSQTLITTAHPEDVPIVGKIWAVTGGLVS